MIAVLLTGAVLGFSAGVAPGPLLVFVISETLRFGVRSGFKVPAAPLITDPPIIVLTLLLICFIKPGTVDGAGQQEAYACPG
jgi:threonine/homoserine/homoserine lactone efflux protein